MRNEIIGIVRLSTILSLALMRVLSLLSLSGSVSGCDIIYVILIGKHRGSFAGVFTFKIYQTDLLEACFWYSLTLLSIDHTGAEFSQVKIIVIFKEEHHVRVLI